MAPRVDKSWLNLQYRQCFNRGRDKHWKLVFMCDPEGHLFARAPFCNSPAIPKTPALFLNFIVKVLENLAKFQFPLYFRHKTQFLRPCLFHNNIGTKKSLVPLVLVILTVSPTPPHLMITFPVSKQTRGRRKPLSTTTRPLHAEL